MKTGKIVLFVAAVLAAIVYFLFVGSALIGGASNGARQKKAQQNKFSMYDKLDSLDKIYAGKTVTTGGDIPVYQTEYQDENKVISYLSAGDQVKIIKVNSNTRKVQIKKGRLTGFVNYQEIPEFKSVADVDDALKAGN